MTKETHKSDGDVKKGILAYNRGVRGVQEGRPNVNNYIAGVLANLTPEFRRQLGLDEEE